MKHRLAQDIFDFGGDRAEALERIHGTKRMHAFHEVALDLANTEKIEVSTNSIARELEDLIVGVIARDKAGEHFNLLGVADAAA